MQSDSPVQPGVLAVGGAVVVGSQFGDGLTGGHRVADIQRRVDWFEGAGVAGAVVDGEHLTVHHGPGEADHTGGRGSDLPTGSDRQIDPAMPAGPGQLSLGARNMSSPEWTLAEQ